MAYRSRVYYTGTGSEQILSVTFPYLDISHVHVYYDAVLQEDDTWSWVTDSTIALTAGSGAEVEIRRSTPYDPMVTFTNASLLNEDDQNMAALQAIYLIEEGGDGAALLEAEVGAINVINNEVAVTFVIDGGEGAIDVGQHGHLVIPFPCTLVSAYIVADQTGSIIVDVWKDVYANFPPTDADSITASAPLTISSGVKALDSVLTGWTLAIAAGDVLAFNVDSCALIRRVTICLVVEK
jgi:hypothetical protein